MTADTKHVWVVEYYADWCGHCKAFKKGFEKAATNLEGLVKFGAVNAENNPSTTQAAGVQGYPSIKIYMPEATRNPYTGKIFKPAETYQGPRSARGMVDAATAALPSHVVAVTDKTLDGFKANGTAPKALLLTQKTETTALLKSLSLSLKGRMLLGEARETSAKATAAALGADSFPSLYVMPDGGAGSPIKYEGELKPAALAAFLEEHAAPAPAADATDGAAAAAAADPLAVEVSAANVAEVVERSKEAWLLVFEGEGGASPIAGGGAEALAEAVFGQVKVAKAAADLAAKFGAGPAPSLIALPFGTGQKSAKKAQKFSGDEAGVAAAKKAALESLPSNLVEVISAQNADRWLGQGVADSSLNAVCILFSDKPTVPPLFRSISMEFEGKLSFGMASSKDGAMMQQFGVDKAPALLVLFPADAPDEEGRQQMQGMKFEPKMHGKFSFGNIANFVNSFVQQREQQIEYEKGGKGGPGGADGGDDAPKKAAPKKELGPLPELSVANFNDECVEKGGLCAIAMLDGAASNSNKEGHLEMLTKLRIKKAGGPLAISWVDATCHVDFAAGFGLSEVDLPTMIVLSPSKLKWARSIGAFDAETLGAFGGGVATGRQRTEPIDALPPLSDVDCASIKRGAELYEEEEDGGDDILAEILEEERKEREAREAEAAAAGADAAAAAAGAKAAKDQMSELERMEADLEECEAQDLLCDARRQKQLKAIEKKRELEEKLAAIAAKKKKAKKKAAKKAKAAA